MTEKNKLAEQFQKEQKEIEEAKKKTSNPDESKEFMDEMERKNTELVVREATQINTYEKSMSIVKNLAKMYLQSQLNSGGDSGKLSESDIALKMLKGHELGLSFIQSFDQISIIKGRSSLSAQAMVALIRNRMPFALIYLDECTDKKCTIRAKRDRRDPQESFLTTTVTIEEFEHFTSNASKILWKTNRADLLYARCSSKMARRLFPDVIQGMYTSEEVRDFDVLPIIDNNGIDPEYLEDVPKKSVKQVLSQDAQDMAALRDEPVIPKVNGNASEALRKAEVRFKVLKKAFPNDMIPFPEWREKYWEKNIKWLPPHMEEKMKKEFEDSKKNGLLNQSIEIYRDNWISEAEVQETYPA
jgi:hypothetical protein